MFGLGESKVHLLGFAMLNSKRLSRGPDGRMCTSFFRRSAESPG